MISMERPKEQEKQSHQRGGYSSFHIHKKENETSRRSRTGKFFERKNQSQSQIQTSTSTLPSTCATENNVERRNQSQSQTQTQTSSSSSTCGCIVILFLVGLICLMGVGIYSIRLEFGSKVPSFSLLSPTTSSTINCDIDLSLRMNTGLFDYLDLKIAKVFVSYSEKWNWDSYVDPFHLMNHNEQKVHLNFSSPPLPEWVASNLAYEKERNGTVKVSFNLEAVGYVPEIRGVLQVSCVNLKLGFSSDFSMAQLMNGPKKCEAHFIDHCH